MKTKNIKFLVVLGIIVLSMLVFNFSVVNASNDEEIVQFKDEKLKSMLINKYGNTFDENGDKKKKKKEMEAITDLSLYRKGIKDLTGLEYATNLKSLDLSNAEPTEGDEPNAITDLTPISNLKNLTFLDLTYNNLSNIEPLKNLTQLEYLLLYGNNIEDISSLSSLINLKELELANNQVRDISALSGLVNLKTLGLYGNYITDFSPISNLELETVNIEGQKVESGNIDNTEDKTNTEDNTEEVKQEENNEAKVEAKGEKDNTPKTGVENNVILPISIIAVMTAIGIIAFKK